MEPISTYVSIKRSSCICFYVFWITLGGLVCCDASAMHSVYKTVYCLRGFWLVCTYRALRLWKYTISASIVYYVCLWYCSCHRPYKVVALSIELLVCLYLCFESELFKNVLDENYFNSTCIMDNRSFVKCFQ